ncbi:MAG: cyclase family protein [Phycisphaerae bacterium]|nr:cyclase family protein [Phycisphaerae bacterium]
MARLIDLSHPLEDGQPNFPDDPSIRIQTHCTVADRKYNLSHISLSSHQGTHLDAPFHFYDDGRTLDKMPLESFFGPAHLIDLAPGSALEPGTDLTVQMFEPHAELFQPGARLIYRTGWESAFGTERFFTDFPSLTLDAARWIAERGIGLLGMDTPTPSRDWLECHHILLHRDVQIVIVEGLRNLAALPRDFTFIGFPLNFKERDGSPIRAVAVVA